MAILPKAIYRLNTIPLKISVAFFKNRNRKNTPTIYMESQNFPNSQRNSEKNKAKGITLPDFKLYYKTIVIKIRILGLKTIGQRNRIENPEIQPGIHSQLIFDKGPKCLMEKRRFFQ